MKYILYITYLTDALSLFTSCTWPSIDKESESEKITRVISMIAKDVPVQTFSLRLINHMPIIFQIRFIVLKPIESLLYSSPTFL